MTKKNYKKTNLPGICRLESRISRKIVQENIVSDAHL